ncbi:MAG: divergent polysaccharide deacetylase family protein [Geobacteraceae bacterium]|nr:divergent polysaccharide deacetylase family protein [Geobacteraceae bacterium]
MKKTNDNRSSKKPGGSRYAALAVAAVIILAVGAYLLNTASIESPPSLPRTIQQVPVPPSQPQPQIPVVKNYSASKKDTSPLHTYPETPHVQEKTPSDSRPSGRAGRLAIIIDDMGSSMQEARSLAGIGVPLTFSVIPGLRSYREVAAFAAANGIETMIHIPMQSKGWPERRLENNGLLVSMEDAAISERIEEFMRSMPRAAGINNHMGSEFTEHEDKMRAVLTVLKGRGLYFVDSVTTPESVGMRLARELDLRSGRRSVFLDNEQDGTYIRGQLNQAVRLAKKTGGVIAICHPHPATIRTLESALPDLARQGITLVPASQLVR